jgi:hypothetical protein
VTRDFAYQKQVFYKKFSYLSIMKLMKKVYTCSMHPEIKRSRPGKCPKCGDMKLVEVGAEPVAIVQGWRVYKPLIVILILLTIVSITDVFRQHQAGGGTVLGATSMSMSMSMSPVSTTNHAAQFSFGNNLNIFMSSFMAGFFIIFAGFKLFDLKGFVGSFAGYDLVASRFLNYGYIYPFIELVLGFAYLLNIQPILTNTITTIVTLVSAYGIWLKLSRKSNFQCACLGTAINLPLSKVTLTEELGMAGMALGMLVVALH